MLLAELATEHGWRLGVELGVLEGRTFLHLLKSCPDLTVIGVDIWEPRPEMEALREQGGRSYSQYDMNALYGRLMKEKAEYGSRGVLLRMPTTAAAQWFPERIFDFCFLDGDHTYEGVKADIEAWLPKVKKGGWLMGHDWQPKTFPGVIKAVRECLGEPHGLHRDRVWSWIV